MTRSATALVVIAGLFGAVGVATAAAGAHLTGDPRLATVSSFLLLHAAALLGAVGAAGALRLGALALLPAWGLATGTLLFCGDLLVRVSFGVSPLPLAAPTGGVILIVAWLALSVGAIIKASRGSRFDA